MKSQQQKYLEAIDRNSSNLLRIAEGGNETFPKGTGYDDIARRVGLRKWRPSTITDPTVRFSKEEEEITRTVEKRVQRIAYIAATGVQKTVPSKGKKKKRNKK